MMQIYAMSPTTDESIGSEQTPALGGDFAAVAAGKSKGGHDDKRGSKSHDQPWENLPADEKNHRFIARYILFIDKFTDGFGTREWSGTCIT
jgi:hypothetical protein